MIDEPDNFVGLQELHPWLLAMEELTDSARQFLKIDTCFSQEIVLEKLIGTVRRGNYSGGLIIAHFTGTGKTYYWNVDDLK
jgi:hypothetical protein